MKTFLPLFIALTSLAYADGLPTAIENQMLGEFGTSAMVAEAGVESKAEVAPEYRLAPVKFNSSIQVIYLISPAK